MDWMLTGAVAYAAAAGGLYQAILGTPILLGRAVCPFGFSLTLELSDREDGPWSGAADVLGLRRARGLSLAGMFLVYTGVSITRVFFITAGTFTAMSLYGYATRADLTRFGSLPIMGLIGIVIATLVNMLLVSSALQFAISVIGIIVFVGLTAWDTQRIKAIYIEGDDEAIAGKRAIMGALALYLDFFNLFLLFMQLFGNRRR
jgi:FtsH-binding integral membrane protein